MCMLTLYMHTHMYTIIRWNERVPYTNYLIHTSGDHGIVFGAVVNGGYPLSCPEHSLITCSLLMDSVYINLLYF